ncbi:MAG TPA: cytochrome P450 [Solirubrobacterales bacterium]|nr:cytochrome P450 [Solirubrobacterales bacterium]
MQTLAPPGPDSNVLAQTIAFHRDPLGFLRRHQEEFGDVFQIRLLTARPTFVVTEPEAVRALLDADPQRAHAGEARRAVLPFASTHSVFGGDAEAHRSARARIAPAFAPELMEARRGAIAAIAERHAASWPLGPPFRLLSRLRTLCDEIFVRLVLGVRDEGIASELTKAIGQTLRTPGNPPVTLPGKGDGLMGELGTGLFEWRKQPTARALARAVEARRADAYKEVDVLGCMIGDEGELTTEQIVDELMSLLMAAQEPPSIALTWLLDRLSREPEPAEEFIADPRSLRSDAIVRETLRLRPPASGALRKLLEPVQVEGRELPAGASVLLPTSLVHRDPRGFRDPDRFEPERWLADITPSWPFFPFGGGARRCVGEPLAHAEIETVVPAVLRTLRLSPISEEPERMVQRATVLVPQRSLLVRASRRD